MTDAAITDEIVERALKALWSGPDSLDMRAALEAVAPLLRAQGMREAAIMAGSPHHDIIMHRARELEEEPHGPAGPVENK